MRWVPIVSLLVLAIHTTPVSDAFDCTPSVDSSAIPLDAGPSGTDYLVQYTIGNGHYIERWHESNGVAGLQHDETWNCGSPGDRLVNQECFGRGCPGVII